MSTHPRLYVTKKGQGQGVYIEELLDETIVLYQGRLDAQREQKIYDNIAHH